jgi:methanethiol S-methyltransferase
MTRRSVLTSLRSITRVFSSFALLHSLLASREAKAAAQTLFGSRHRNGLYRFLYNAHSVLLVTGGWIWISRLPDHELYHLRPPFSWLLRAVQLASFALAVSAARGVGLGKITGIQPFSRFLNGETPPREPEAQGPPPAEPSAMQVPWPFRLTRHPLNLAPVGIFLCFPRMTVNRLLIAGLSLLYLMLGSIHEEVRLTRAYGEAYRRYQRSGVPFFFPKFFGRPTSDENS